jgi:hypothetical protein
MLRLVNRKPSKRSKVTCHNHVIKTKVLLKPRILSDDDINEMLSQQRIKNQLDFK